MTRIYVAIAALLLLVSIGGGFYLHHRWFDDGYQAKTAEVERQATKDAAKAQTRTVAGDAGAKAATDAGNVKIAANEAQTNEVVRIVTRTVHDKPSPVQCVADVVSVHALQSAASAANSTASQLPVSRAR